jgi:thiosulfate/3-mercaptopyruvate sulfurtransferase
MTLQKQLEYAHPEVLVDTQWAEDHLKDPKIRIAEVDYDRKTNYELGIYQDLFSLIGKDINEPKYSNQASV